MNLLGLVFVLLFAGLMAGFSFLHRKRTMPNLREIPSFSRLRNAIDLAVEDGSRLHLSLGHADITGAQSAAGLVGLSMLRRISLVAADSDQPPVVTAGDGTLALLAQDTLRNAHITLGSLSDYSNTMGRVAGVTPFSYAAGTISLIRDEGVSANLLIGSFGHEIALITTAGERSQVLSLAGTDTLTAQAVAYATAHEQLIGEELFAGGAYVGAGPMHTASLHAQDVIRWLLITAILLSALVQLVNSF
ncbi:MAG: hypothetical protein OEZ02_13260 [Anaerolineae bacterium]|nr:hypothetical protein [Anaerolineae bacterium]